MFADRSLIARRNGLTAAALCGDAAVCGQGSSNAIGNQVGIRPSESVSVLSPVPLLELLRHCCIERSRPRLSRNQGTSGPGQIIVNRANPAAIKEPPEG
jgi:hypothetical protein